MFSRALNLQIYMYTMVVFRTFARKKDYELNKFKAVLYPIRGRGSALEDKGHTLMMLGNQYIRTHCS